MIVPVDLRRPKLIAVVANNGLEALEKIRKVSSLEQPRIGQPFDCVLMDLEMPGECTDMSYWLESILINSVMDGLTALRHIREEEAAGTLALNLVIALSKSR